MYKLPQGKDDVKIHVQLVSSKRWCKDTCKHYLNEEIL